jgi:putative ABC transport system ATP-binding protein
LPRNGPQATLRAMLSVRNLGKSFAGPRARSVLRDLSFQVAAGEYIAVMGESGIGKSTLLNLVAGLDKPDTGSIELDGIELTGLDDDALSIVRRQRIGFVFQAFHVLPYLNVAQNVALPLALNGVDDAAAARRVDELLEAVGMRERAESMPRELSGGELQRIAIARAVVHRPRLVLADEPTGNLDPDSASGVLALLRDCVRQQGAAGILVTHSTAAAKTADRTVLLTGEALRPA